MDDDRSRSDPAQRRDLERRTSGRIPVEMWVEEITEGNQVFRRAGNLSRGGIYLDHTIPLPIGTTVQLRFTLPGDKDAIVLAGQTVSVAAQEHLGMGVKFTTVPPPDQERIDAYLERTLTPVQGT